MAFFRFLKNHDFILLLILYITIVALAISENHEPFCGDGEGYYMYLPAAFISHDFHHLTSETTEHRTNEKGEVVIKYSCGTAYFFLPFFLAAHSIATVFHLPVTGYSPPYRLVIFICGASWVFLGLFLLKKLLARYFSWAVTWMVLLSVFLGTNLYFYTVYAMTMSHIYGFALTCGILLLTDTFFKQPGRFYLLLLAFLFGWLTFMRPTNFSMILFILLYRVSSVTDFKERIIFFRNRLPDLLLAVPIFLLPMLPQVFYWKEMLGKFVVYSYSGERFLYWKNPKIAEVLFDTQNGLFIYAPVLLFFIYGLFAARKDQRASFAGISLLFIIITWTFASWHAWWFGGAYGHRCYIEYLPVLAFPLALAFEKIFNSRKKPVKYPFIVLILLCMYYNLAMTYQFSTQLNWDGPKWRWNWSTWGIKVNHTFSKFKD